MLLVLRYSRYVPFPDGHTQDGELSILGHKLIFAGFISVPDFGCL
jgi:hypothetical protein